MSIRATQAAEQQRFVEEMGLFIEQLGQPRMIGRILGWLLVCDPPHQSLAQLAEALQASRGSISTMTRQLVAMGVVQRVSLPGERRDYVQLQRGVWAGLIKQRLAQIAGLRHLAERGLTTLEGESDARRARLEELRDIYAWFEREMPAFLERWEREMTAKLSSRRRQS